MTLIIQKKKKTEFLYHLMLKLLDKEFAATIMKMLKDLKAK